MTNQTKWGISFLVAAIVGAIFLTPIFVPNYSEEIMAAFLGVVFLTSATSLARNTLFQN